MQYMKKLTRWEPNSEGDLVCVGSGDPAWRTIAMAAHYFPLNAESVARMMNHAFKLGMDAKAAEIKATLGLGDA